MHTTTAPPTDYSTDGSVDHRPLGSTAGQAVVSQMFRRLGLRSVYVMVGFPMALISFVLVVTVLSLGLGLLITFIGVPLLVGLVFMARGLAWTERLRLSKLMEVPPTPVVYKTCAPDAGWFRRLVTPLGDSQSWLDVLHGIAHLPVAVAAWTVVVTWWAGAVGGLTWPLWGWTLPTGSDNADLPELLGLSTNYGARATFYVIIGALFAVSLPFAVMLASKASAALSTALLIAPSRHRQEVSHLVAGRDATRSAEQTSLRRLERDIHDGPQQRLVRLSMDLGRAGQKVQDSPELADALEDARRQTQETLDELRALSRGIAPPILVDRGLATALEELTIGSEVPMNCTVSLADDRLPDHVESAIYFVAAEALTNINKHSAATNGSVLVQTAGSYVHVVVTDNGTGGANMAKGHGLAGLAERVRAVDGELDLNSPVGGPTALSVRIPCGS